MKNKIIILFLFFSIQLTSGSLADHCGHDMDRTWFIHRIFHQTIKLVNQEPNIKNGPLKIKLTSKLQFTA